MNPTLTATHRIFNFSAGPATLPLPVLEEAQRDLLSLPGVGMSVMEISHRSKPFDEIIQGAEADFRKLAGLTPEYKVLFLQGGASLLDGRGLGAEKLPAVEQQAPEAVGAGEERLHAR